MLPFFERGMSMRSFIMQISKVLITTAAAAAMAGVLTVAYAQSTAPAESPAAPAMQSQPMTPATPAAADTTTQTPSASPSTPAAPAETTQFQGERPAQADRN
jgi:hypothetical protein